MSYLDVLKKKLTVFADEMVIKRNDNVARWKKWDGQTRVIGWKANASTPGMESAGKCPTIARGGGDGHCWNWLMHYFRFYEGR